MQQQALHDSLRYFLECKQKRLHTAVFFTVGDCLIAMSRGMPVIAVIHIFYMRTNVTSIPIFFSGE